MIGARIVKIIDGDGPSKVAIGKSPDQIVVPINHGGAAETFAAHLNGRVSQRGVAVDFGQRFPRRHDLVERRQASAELATGMKRAKIVRRKPSRLHKRNGERVTKDHLHRGGGRRRQFVRARFGNFRQSQADIGRFSNPVLGMSRRDDERLIVGRSVTYDVTQFGG